MTLITTANGTTLFHDLRGPEGAPMVVFSNSIGTTLEMWDAQAAALATGAATPLGAEACQIYNLFAGGGNEAVDFSAIIGMIAGKAS